MEKQKVEEVLEIFKRKKVMAISSLVPLLQCSIPTVRNRLKEWKALTSCNCNGRYYVLPRIPQFNQHGLWRFQKILFSKFGNLKLTFINLVERAPRGLNVSEVSEILSLPSTTFLSHLKNHSSIQRKKYQGVYIYFSAKREIFERQRKKREQEIEDESGKDLPRDTDAIIILVELIKHPRDNMTLLTRRARKQGASVSQENVHNLLLFHGLLKKTPI